jgi:hypothetical protein
MSELHPIYRCRAHFQGDKCRLSLDHEGAHASPLHSWTNADKIDELKPPPMLQAERDWKRLMKTALTVRKPFFRVFLMAVKNCDEYLKEAFRVRHEGGFKRNESKTESPVEGSQA